MSAAFKPSPGWHRSCEHVAAHFFVFGSPVCGAPGLARLDERQGEPMGHWRACRRCLVLEKKARAEAMAKGGGSNG